MKVNTTSNITRIIRNSNIWKCDIRTITKQSPPNTTNIIWNNKIFSSKPLFVDKSGNYKLQLNSPCINTGNPDLDNDGITWENDPDDQDPDGTRMDMGALYFPFMISLEIPNETNEDSGILEKQGKVSIDFAFN